MVGFEIYDLEVAGGTLALSPLPGRDGQLSRDLAILARWNPTLVVSMTPEAELASLGLEDLGQRLRQLGIARACLPLADFAAPAKAEWPIWQKVSQDVRANLTKGGRVLFHCIHNFAYHLSSLIITDEIHRPTLQYRTSHPQALVYMVFQSMRFTNLQCYHCK